MGRAEKTLLALGVLAFGIPIGSSADSPLAVAFLTGCLGRTLRWQATGRPRDILLAGALAALSFSSKQDFGLLVLAALAASIELSDRERLDRAHGRLLAITGFAAGAACFLVPIAMSGGWSWFIEYAFTAKQIYLRVGHVSFLDGLANVDSLETLYRKPMFFFPAVLPLLSVVWLRAKPAERPRTAAVLFFAAAAVVGVYPRLNDSHFQMAVPPLMVALVYAVHNTGLSRTTVAVIAAWLAAGVGLTAAKPLFELIRGRYSLVELPHFRSVLVAPETAATLRRDAARLRKATGGDPVFLLKWGAARDYLASGLRNPTPFDYPYASSLGLRGQEELIRSIDEGRLRTVCVGRGAEELELPQLTQHVPQAMVRVRDLGFCALYRTMR